MSSEWDKLIESAEKLRLGILKDRKYAPAEKSINHAVRILKSVENKLIDIENPKTPYNEHFSLTKKGMQMVQGKKHFARAVRQLYEKYGVNYVGGNEMVREVSGEGKIYVWDLFSVARRKAFKEGVFERMRKGIGYTWRVSPDVVQYL